MTKRSFYEDDDYIVNKPGTTTPITPSLAQKESVHGDVTFVDGMVIRTTPLLEKYANAVRHFVHDKVSLWGAELATQQSAARNEWRIVRREVTDVIREPVLPGLIYVLTASLTGSILVRRSNVLVRFVTPLAFGIGAVWWVMPRTFEAVGRRYGELEREYAPDVYVKRVELGKDVEEFKKSVEQGVEDVKTSVLRGVHDLRKTIKEQWE
ncbi:MICOS subunit MIC26 [Candida viswanathii]|uniref:MICOS complex subunit n=1 Tax=Candida viswanathii TaxID=5486 RepID=A0A367YF06_9ASCO|nr:MICOS subunit MIC26 [Candida viswanathii]